MQAAFVNKPCGCYAAVNHVFVGLVISVVRTDPYWQQFHGVNSALYSLASRAFGFLAFSGKHLEVQPRIQGTSVSMCI